MRNTKNTAGLPFTIMATLIILFVWLIATPKAHGQDFTKAEIDSFRTELQNIDDGDAPTMLQLRMMSAIMEYDIIKRGHKEYVSMPKYAKNGIAIKVQTRQDDLEKDMFRFKTRHDIDSVENVQAKQTIADIVNRLNNVEPIVVDHDNQLRDLNNLTVAVKGGDDDQADSLIEKIKIRVKKPK